MPPKPTAADKDRLDSLEASLENLQATVQTTVHDDVRRVEGTVAELGDSVATLGGRLQALETTSAATQASVDEILRLIQQRRVNTADADRSSAGSSLQFHRGERRDERDDGGRDDRREEARGERRHFHDRYECRDEPYRHGRHDRYDDQHRPMFPARYAKLEFPRFAGNDPTEWFTRVDQFFEYQQVEEEQKVPLASYHLEGEANQWWRWLQKSYIQEGLNVTWELFANELWTRFGPADEDDADEALSRIRQTGTLRDYQREFERLGNKVQVWTQKALVGAFMGGLQPEIFETLRLFRPDSLKEAIRLARIRDEQLRRAKTVGRPVARTANEPSNKPMDEPPMRSGRPQLARRIPWEEQQRRRAAGLCFNCDEKFVPGHRCKRPALLLCDGFEEDYVEEVEKEEHEVSFHAMNGLSAGRTMRMWAKIGSAQLMVLVDSGSTHNFVASKIAARYHLPVTHVKNFDVRIANGEPLPCNSRHDDVKLAIQGLTFSLSLYAIDVAGIDVVLGIQWLASLGNVLCNWHELTMDFDWQGQRRRLTGLAPKVQESESLKSLLKDIPQGVLHALCMPSTDDDAFRQIPDAFQDMIRDFGDLFEEPTTLPPSRSITHRIQLKEAADAVNVRPYRYAHFQKEEIESQVNKMLRDGLIRPSTSPFSSPVLLVKKKDGTWRFCTDYRALNAVTVKDRFPIPTVDDMLDELHGAAYFTKLDLRAGYHQVRMHPTDVPKTAFRTHNGHYEYLVMPFGLCNASTTFQALMNEIFRDHLRKFVLVFLDDILIYSKDMTSHLSHLRQVFLILRKHRFFVKFSKCAICLHELEYLGHIITAGGVKVIPAKIQAMIQWPRPTSATELRGFLGLTGYYRKFVRNYGLIARPLTQLLKKGQFAWKEDATAAFEALKIAMTSTPTLAMPDFTKPFVVETDASDHGLGAVLMQGERPIAFMSRALGVQKQGLSAYAKEMMAIIAAVQLWRPYLLGRQFFIRTDQRSLRFLLEQRNTTPEQQKWVSKLLVYDYVIIYKPGRENQAADALSRRPLVRDHDGPHITPNKGVIIHNVERTRSLSGSHIQNGPDPSGEPTFSQEPILMTNAIPTSQNSHVMKESQQLNSIPSDEVSAGASGDKDHQAHYAGDKSESPNPSEKSLAISHSFSTLGEALKRAVDQDPYLQGVIQKANSQNPGHFSVKRGMALYDDRVVLSPNSPLVDQLLNEYHSTPSGGHSGVLRTYKRLASQFFWPNMLESIKRFVASCEVCQQAKTQALAPAGLLQPLPIPTLIWDELSMDFIDDLPSSPGKTVILVVVDRLSKAAHFMGLSHPYTAKTVADAFVNGVVKLHGIPRSIVSDRDPVFVSNFWRELFRQSGTTLSMSSSYHPQTDGQTEVVNRSLEQYLRCFTHQQPRRWMTYLPWAEFWYNSTYHRSIGTTPFQAVYGRAPPTIRFYQKDGTVVHEVDQALLDRNEVLQDLRVNLQNTQTRMKQLADAGRRDEAFEVGDLVYLRLHPYRQHLVYRRASQKLAARFHGPYRVVERIGPVAYRVSLPVGSRVHPVFHVSLLRRCNTPDTPINKVSPPIADDGALELIPETILDTRWVRRGNKFIEESLVKWHSLPREDSTWEHTAALFDHFDDHSLEDKAILPGGGNDELMSGTSVDQAYVGHAKVGEPNKRG
ncbi:unnamed protein product [Linum trigynum]|uniref:RNA-directed DNA polymerase n=1 Tax=Linum trigynum TaxID=586398 RepID=A0AAV2FC63_9ROSI